MMDFASRKFGKKKKSQTDEFLKVGFNEEVHIPETHWDTGDYITRSLVGTGKVFKDGIKQHKAKEDAKIKEQLEKRRP
jgi:hypothetical protein